MDASMSPLRVAIYVVKPKLMTGYPSLSDQERECRELAREAECQIVGVYAAGVELSEVDGEDVSLAASLDYVLATNSIDMILFLSVSLVLEPDPESHGLSLLAESIRSGVGWCSVLDGLLPISEASDLLMTDLLAEALEDPVHWLKEIAQLPRPARGGEGES